MFFNENDADLFDQHIQDQINYYNQSMSTDDKSDNNNNVYSLRRERPNLFKLAEPVGKPRLSILGLGYVGAVSSACFSELGHHVIGVDPDSHKVLFINTGKSPFIEKDLDELLHAAHINKTLEARTDTISAILQSDITLVSVGTPSDKNGGCDLRYLRKASEEIGLGIKQKEDYHLVVFRSTVPPRTTQDILIPIIEKYSGKCCGKEFGVCFNPEFLRESSAIDDFYHPPKTVIGAFDDRSCAYARKLYSDVDGALITTSIEAAEFVKYVDNTWHALKVTFGNEVGRICKACEVDSHEVIDIFLQDTKLNISPYYLRPGMPFGGSCLPKDTRGIVQLARSLNVDTPVIDNILTSNLSHIWHTIDMIENIGNKNIGILGLTFKPGTDDMRESPSITLMETLLEMDYKVSFFDPCLSIRKISDTHKSLLSGYCGSIDQLFDAADTIVIAHDYDYNNLLDRKNRTGKTVIDLVHLSNDQQDDLNYQGVCW